MYVSSKAEFCEGMVLLGYDTIDKLRAKLPELEHEILERVKFEELYQFTFNYAKNSSQKVIFRIFK